MDKPSEYEIKVLRSLEEIEDIRTFWETHQYYPDSDMDFYIAFCRANKANVKPLIYVLIRQGKPEAIMIGRIDNADYNINFGYKVIFGTRLHLLNILYGGIIGTLSDPGYHLLFESLMKSLSRGEADIAIFNHLKIDSPIYHLATRRPHYLFRDHAPKVNQHWRSILPDSFDEFYSTRPKNFKNNLKKYTKKLNDRYGENKIIKTYRQMSEYSVLLDDIESIASKTYHRGMGTGFKNNQTTKDRIILALEQKRFRAYIMYIDRQPCAFLTGVRYGDTFFPWATGYDPAFHQYSPGTLIIMEMFKALYDEGRIHAIDFGFGEAFYKHNFCNDNWQEAPVYIYAPTLMCGMLNVMKSLLDVISGFTEYALNKLNLTAKVKKIWRDKLAAGKNNHRENLG